MKKIIGLLATSLLLGQVGPMGGEDFKLEGKRSDIYKKSISIDRNVDDINFKDIDKDSKYYRDLIDMKVEGKSFDLDNSLKDQVDYVESIDIKDREGSIEFKDIDKDSKYYSDLIDIK